MRRISPLFLAFAALYVASEGYLLARGNGTGALVTAAALGAFCILTAWCTRNAGAEPPSQPGRLVWLQLLACAFVAAATAIDGASLSHVAPVWLRVPLWSTARAALVAATAPHVPADIANGIANLTFYCLPALIVLLALGVPLAAQGFGAFRRGSAGAAFTWLTLPVAYFLWFVLTGRLSPSLLLRVCFSNLLQNGFSEEYLWRGAIMGRLRAVMSGESALYLQALLFGLWHAGADLQAFKGNLAGAAAEMIAVQMMVGLALGFVTQRTGNIAIAAAFHMLLDSANDVGP